MLRREALALAVFIVTMSIASVLLIPKPTIKISYNNLTKEARKQVDCLADNIYFEAGKEPADGKLAVALVTMNRVKSGIYPDNICDVVKQRRENTCQFTWWCISKTKLKAIDRQFTDEEMEQYNKSQLVALQVYLNHDTITDITQGAMFYHATYVSPQWRGMEKTIEIGQHIFYKRTSTTWVQPTTERTNEGF